MSTATEERDALASYRWRNRLLLIFAPTTHHRGFREQVRQVYDHVDGFAERDLIPAEILEIQRGRIGSIDVPPEIGQDIREEFDAPPGKFTVVLVGKDGSVKMRSEWPVPAEEIFDVIDRMPMRRQEMSGAG